MLPPKRFLLQKESWGNQCIRLMYSNICNRCRSMNYLMIKQQCKEKCLFFQTISTSVHLLLCILLEFSRVCLKGNLLPFCSSSTGSTVPVFSHKPAVGEKQRPNQRCNPGPKRLPTMQYRGVGMWCHDKITSYRCSMVAAQCCLLHHVVASIAVALE